jgi:hypothetical protein
MNTDDRKNRPVLPSRRKFVASSAVAFAGLLGSTSLAQTTGNSPSPQTSSSSHRFHFGQVYSSAQTKQLVLPSGGTKAGTFTAPTGIPFWWDPTAKKLVNATNVPFDSSNIPAGDYQLAATLLSFRASQKDLGDVWNKLTNNAQLNINPSSVSSEGDSLNWILMTGIKLAQNLLNKNDPQSVSLSQASTSNNNANTPTAKLASAEGVAIKKGVCQLAVTLEAQQKQSVWDRLMGLLKTASTVTGLLPIPKLYQTALNSVLSSLDQLQAQNAKSHLLTILGGMSYNYKLYSGANSGADLTLRSGKWVFIDSGFAQDNFDAQNNLKNAYLFIGGELYQVTDENNKPIDTTYVVVNLQLDKAPAAKAS